jgi:hypothetical protein
MPRLIWVACTEGCGDAVNCCLSFQPERNGTESNMKATEDKCELKEQVKQNEKLHIF